MGAVWVGRVTHTHTHTRTLGIAEPTLVHRELCVV